MVTPPSMMLQWLSGLFAVYLWLLVATGVASAQSVDAPPAEVSAADESAPLPDPDALRNDGDAPGLLNAAGLSRGVDAIIAAIRDREVELIQREQKIAERERSVVELESLIEQRTLELERIRQNVEDRISSWATQGPDRIQQLASVYSAMPAGRAANLLAKLDLDLAVSVVQNMKKKQSAGVLAAMKADRALLISRRMLQPLSPQTDAPAARRK